MSEQGPPSTPPGVGNLPRNIEELLRDAAQNEDLRRRLTTEREAVLADADVALTTSEQEILRAVPDRQLQQMIDAIRQSGPLSTSATLGSELWQCQGIRPDMDWNPVKGTRMDLPFLPGSGPLVGCIVRLIVLAGLIALLIWLFSR